MAAGGGGGGGCDCESVWATSMAMGASEVMV